MKPERRYNSLFRFYGRKHKVAWRWLLAQARAESALDPRAVSSSGAEGLAQFMPQTWAEWGDGGDVWNPEHAIRAQARYMRWLLDRTGGEMDKALAAYNWGIGNVTRAGDAWRSKLPRETRDYIARIHRLGWRLVSA